MRFAIIKDNKVINIAESTYPLTDDWIQIDYGTPVGIDDTYDGQIFYSPDGEIRMSYIQKSMQNKVDEAHIQITDLESAFDSLMGGVSVALGL